MSESESGLPSRNPHLADRGPQAVDAHAGAEVCVTRVERGWSVLTTWTGPVPEPPHLETWRDVERRLAEIAREHSPDREPSVVVVDGDRFYQTNLRGCFRLYLGEDVVHLSHARRVVDETGERPVRREVRIGREEVGELAALLARHLELTGGPPPLADEDATPAKRALAIAFRHGGTDEAHHLRWVLDQMVRALAGDGYEAWVRERKAGEDGPETYGWDPGVAP